jgi:3',5'-nucleoside bisphosphate phosphatase
MSSKRFIDLHLHSTCSDGAHAPTAVIRMAADAGLAAVALCDHDNIDGIDEALAAGRVLGVEVLSGVELSVVWEGIEDIHLLGYGFDHQHAGLRRALQEFRDFRENRNEQVVARVNDKLRHEGRQTIDFERVMALAGGTVGRPHIATALREQQLVATSEEAFQRYLIPCNVPKRYFPIAEAIDLIHAADGVAVLAHPPFVTNDRAVFLRLLDALVVLGLAGVEAYSNGAANDDIDWYITESRRRGLLVTGGSDFHGMEGEVIVAGGSRGNLWIPYALLDELRQAVAARRRGDGVRA